MEKRTASASERDADGNDERKCKTDDQGDGIQHAADRFRGLRADHAQKAAVFAEDDPLFAHVLAAVFAEDDPHTSKLTDIDCFNYKMLYELGDHIHTDFVMIVHADGFIVHPELWRDEFLDYDYIGSPWPVPDNDYVYRDINGNLCRVGNSVGIRSRRLVNFPKEAGLPFEPDHGSLNEDGFLCVKNRHLVEAAGMRIAPLEVAKYFAHETMIPEIEGITPFAFHKWAGTNAEYPRF